MALEVEAAGERMRRRHVDISQCVSDQLDTFDGPRVTGADRGDAHVGSSRKVKREMLELRGKIIVDEKNVHSGLI